jgi:thiamine biosynthesis lipoprotein
MVETDSLDQSPAERRDLALREHKRREHAELELCAPAAYDGAFERSNAGRAEDPLWAILQLCIRLLIFLLAGCCSTPTTAILHRFEFHEPHMGTLFSISLYSRDGQLATNAAKAAFQRVAELDSIMTDYNPDSELMRLCRSPAGRSTHVSRDLFDVLAYSEKVSRQTGGAFDVTVGPYVVAWRAARKTGSLPSAHDIATMRESVGYEKLRLDARRLTVTLLAPNMRLDLGGIGKGYAADKALKVLKQRGITRALVAASGDIAIGEAPPGKAGWRVGIGAMDGATDEVARTVLLHDAGVSTSGDSEQNVEINGVRYSHIIDPVTGLGLTNRIQVTIIGPNATVTDGLDTPLGIMGVDRALALVNSRQELAAIITTRDDNGKHVFLSRQFRERFGAK